MSTSYVAFDENGDESGIENGIVLMRKPLKMLIVI